MITNNNLKDEISLTLLKRVIVFCQLKKTFYFTCYGYQLTLKVHLVCTTLLKTQNISEIGQKWVYYILKLSDYLPY